MGMTIAIKDFEMPKTCDDCPYCIYTADEKRYIGYCNTSDDDYFCKALDRFMEYDKVDGGVDILGKPLDCPLVEAIPKADYENRLKADMAAMLEDLRFQAEENIENIYEKDEDNILMLAQHNAFADCFAQYNSLIEERIDALKGD